MKKYLPSLPATILSQISPGILAFGAEQVSGISTIATELFEVSTRRGVAIHTTLLEASIGFVWGRRNASGTSPAIFHGKRPTYTP